MGKQGEDKRDEVWLLARARGEPAERPDPKRAAQYERLERALAALPPPEAPGNRLVTVPT